MSPMQSALIKFLVPAVGSAVVIGRFRRHPNLAEALVWPTPSQARVWVALYLGWMLATDWTMDWRGPFDLGPWLAAPISASILRVLAVVVAGPVLEELVFRGLGFSALSRTRIGPVGAVIVTSTLWSMLHIEYSADVIAVIAVAGLVLGCARWRTGSVYLPIGMHMAWNLYAVW